MGLILFLPSIGWTSKRLPPARPRSTLIPQTTPATRRRPRSTDWRQRNRTARRLIRCTTRLFKRRKLTRWELGAWGNPIIPSGESGPVEPAPCSCRSNPSTSDRPIDRPNHCDDRVSVAASLPRDIGHKKESCEGKASLFCFGLGVDADGRVALSLLLSRDR